MRWLTGTAKPLGSVAAAAGAFYVGWQIGTQIRVWARIGGAPANVSGVTWTFYASSSMSALFGNAQYNYFPTGLPPFMWRASTVSKKMQCGTGITPVPTLACSSGTPTVVTAGQSPQVGEYQMWSAVSNYWAQVGFSLGDQTGPWTKALVPTIPGDTVPSNTQLDNWPVTTTNIPSEEQVEAQDPCAMPTSARNTEDCYAIGWPVTVNPKPNDNNQHEPGEGWSPLPQDDFLNPPQASPNGDPTNPDRWTEANPPVDNGVEGSPDSHCQQWVKPRLNFKPLNVPLWNVFPFAVPFVLYRIVDMFDGSGTAPSWSIPIHNSHLVANLAVIDPYMAVFRTVLGLMFFVSSGLMVSRWAFGSPGDD